MSLLELNKDIQRILTEIESQRDAGLDWDCELLHRELSEAHKDKLELLKPITQSLVKDVAAKVEFYMICGKHWADLPMLKSPEDCQHWIHRKSSFDYLMKVEWSEFSSLMDWLNIIIEVSYPKRFASPSIDPVDCLSLFGKENQKDPNVKFYHGPNSSYLHFWGNYQGIICHLRYSNVPDCSPHIDDLPSKYDFIGNYRVVDDSAGEPQVYKSSKLNYNEDSSGN